MTDVLARLGVPSIVNAAGKLTALGGSAQHTEVAAAQAGAAQVHVEIQALRDAVGKHIATLTGAESACVTTGAAAGIAISVAACITGTDLSRVYALPDVGGRPNGVLLQAGHDIDFGAQVTQMIRLGGGRPIIVGTKERVKSADFDLALADCDEIVAMLFVQSHHCLQQDRFPLERCVGRCHAVDIPVIVDAAAEEDLRHYVAVGADLVTYSGGKAFSGPTSGFIAGRHDLIAACELQQRGIARTMKVGKEQLVGLHAALERYVARDAVVDAKERAAVLDVLMVGLATIPGISVTRHRDEAGRNIERIALRCRGDLRQLIRDLAAGSPSIRTRNHHIDDGYVLIDPREIDTDQAHTIVTRVREILNS